MPYRKGFESCRWTPARGDFEDDALACVSWYGARAFCRVRSYLSTARKQTYFLAALFIGARHDGQARRVITAHRRSQSTFALSNGECEIEQSIGWVYRQSWSARERRTSRSKF